MKKFVLILVLFAGSIFAQGKNNGVGLWVANYGFGADLKMLNSNETAWDFYLGGFRLSSKDGLSLSGDVAYYFLLNNIIKMDASNGRIPLYWGPDIGVSYNDGDFGIYGNLVGGISWFLPTSLKMDISAELFPGIALNINDDETELGFNGVGFRLLYHIYFF